MDHCVCIGANLVDIGALTNFVYLYQNRENIYDLLEACCGARLTVSYVRVGGLADRRPGRLRGALPARCSRRSRRSSTTSRSSSTTTGSSATGSPGTGVVTKEQAIAWGLTGPDAARLGRAPTTCGARAPTTSTTSSTGTSRSPQDGDNFARYLVRMEEMRQSLKIIRQALDIFPASGPVNSDDWHVVLPPKDAVYHDMESLIYHFKLVMEGIRVPAGERYEWIEGGNGELGFYAVSDGRGGPYRLKVRPPCFPNMAAFEKIDRRRHGLRRRRDARHAQRHRGGARPMSGVDRRQPAGPEEADASAEALHARDPPRAWP